MGQTGAEQMSQTLPSTPPTYANSQTLALVDLVGGLAVVAAATKATPILKPILYGFAGYALYGAYQHATGGIKVETNANKARQPLQLSTLNG
jgi:hypothetical protein